MTLPETLLQASTDYLDSEAARRSIARDPYWPKWDSPWWHMTLLWELGLAAKIPPSAVAAMTTALKSHYLPFFPTKKEQLPQGADPRLHVLCQCAVGTMHQVLTACGVPVDVELPWLKRLLLDTQLPDGGVNCDEAAYEGSRKSSLVSTLPALEAVLLSPGRRTPEDWAFLDRGADYLIRHELVKSSSGRLINPDWLKPCFPRFYHYDIQRGRRFLARYSALRGKTISPVLLLDEPRKGEAGRWALESVSLVFDGALWSRGPATGFPLLEAVKGTIPA